MKTIELYLWSRIGHDGDGYETDYEVSDEEYNTIVHLIKEYRKQGGEDGFDAKEFSEDFLSEHAADLYNKLEEETSQEIIASIKEDANYWFDAESEGCTIDEYIENNYYWGFWITEDFIDSI